MERPVQIVVVIALTLATGAMYAVSMRANYLYGLSIGQNPETKFAIAWANVAADLWKGFGLIVAVGLWRARSRRAAAIICGTWFVCLCFSVSSAIAIYLQERSALVSGREAQHASFRDAERELHEIEDMLKTRSQVTSVVQVEAAIVAMLARAVTTNERVRGTVATVSTNCTKYDVRTAEACGVIASLRTQLAEVTDTARLTERAISLRDKVRALRERGSASSPDPVGEFWAWLTRGQVSAKDVGFGLPLAFALMIEMVSAFGPLGIVSYTEATRVVSHRDMSRPVGTGRDISRPIATSLDTGEDPGSDEFDQIVAYIAERTEPTVGGAGIGVGEIFADYCAWCAQARLPALEMKNFARLFDELRVSPELHGAIKEFGGRYVGIALVATKDVASATT